MSHGDQQQKAKLVQGIRALEKEFGRPTTILFDLQGPKLRVGHFKGGKAVLESGARFLFDQDDKPGSAARVQLPHPELFDAVRPGTNILIDDGKVRLNVVKVGDGEIVCEIKVGGTVSDNKGVNVPDVLVPIPALTEKDRDDLKFALEQRADWVALSFVQRPEDVAEARTLIGDRAALLAKIEKPAAVDRLNDIIALADAVMVARGDLGVELPPEQVPPLQNKIVATARQYGKPVVVATQMLESMISSPTPTRAEVSDVAKAIYDGADAVMLSAESAAGKYPCEAVQMMDRIAVSVERDPSYQERIAFHADAAGSDHRRCDRRLGPPDRQHHLGDGDAVLHQLGFDRPPHRARAAAGAAAGDERVAAYRAPHGPAVGRSRAAHQDVSSFEEMVEKAKRMAIRYQLAKGGDRVIIMAGIPFGKAGSTNVLHVVRLTGDELDRYER